MTTQSTAVLTTPVTPSQSAASAPSYKAVLKRYEKSHAGVKWHFGQLPKLIHHDFPYDVCLAYLFLRLENAHNKALYCGVVKLHQANGEMASNIINSHHLTREGFLGLYEAVFGAQLPNTTQQLIRKAEEVRDAVIHGKNVSDPKIREALVDVIAYAEKLNEELKSKAGFEPFGDVRGFKGARKPLEKSTSRWLLKGLGFHVS